LINAQCLFGLGCFLVGLRGGHGKELEVLLEGLQSGHMFYIINNNPNSSILYQPIIHFIEYGYIIDDGNQIIYPP
jgi:hypothetical protein